ncbi:MAG: hypothetical protein JOS17DRAFT_296531 [Linnemannia elongata]|nr:MAG: hypothetical protein JOS17DRAFT_296531 [Linnemannia elongata]
MLSSYHGKSAPSPSLSTVSIDNSRPYFNNGVTHNRRTSNNNDSFGTKSLNDESSFIEPTDAIDIHQLMLQKSNLKKNSSSVCQQSPRKQFANAGNKTAAQQQQIDNSLAGLENTTSSSSSPNRLQRTDLSITTDLLHQHQQHGGSPLVCPAPMQQLQHPYSARSAVPDTDFLWNTPPANCKMPNPNLSRRASLAAVMMSPPSSAGLIKSTANHGVFSSRDFVMGESVKEPDMSKQKAVQKRINNLCGPSRRHSVPNLSAARQANSHNNNVNSSKNATLQRMTMGAFGIPGTATDGSYPPTPTDSAFHSSISGDNHSQFPDFSTSTTHTMTSHLSPTPTDAYFASGVHPFDLLSGGTGGADAWVNNGAAGMSPVPPPMSTATKSATIQYLQQLQQSMICPDSQSFSNIAQQQPQPKQQKTSQTGSQSRRGSKAKVKRRVGSVPAPAPPMLQSYMPTDMNWSLPPSDQQLLANGVCQQQQVNSSGVSAPLQPPPTSSATPRTFYHGPTPCGNPEPLYEYLASPTIVPGLEIIGHDFYGNYVQILPICPDTTCSMNQDPVYLNLLQAIYAHTIPFLDLAPGSEEESQLLNNGTPSAIATQSIQPPFKNLLPFNGPAGQNSGVYSARMTPSGSHAALSQHSTLTSSVSSPSFQQLSANGSNNSNAGSSKLLRRASMASISSNNGNATSNSRRSSVVSNPSLSNPAKKKKNAPRTHPYKSTSSFKEDNPMVTEAILTQVGGLGGIGNSATVSATDPRHKVAEKMVHMDEAEYAAHYSKHQHAMNKSASTMALCLAQTLVTSMSGSSLGPLNPSSLMSSSVTAPSITNAMTSSSVGNGSMANNTSSSSPLESIAAADFIRALSECSGSMNDLGLQGESMSTAATEISLSEHDLLSLENLMMMDSNAAAAVQAAAATAWPNWFDLSQLEKDVCEAGLGHQASAFSSASCSMANLPLSTSSTLTSFANHYHGNNNTARDALTTNLLLSSSTNLAMMDDLFDDNSNHHQQSLVSKALPGNSDQDTEMIMVSMSPVTNTSNVNSTSQVLVFDQLSASPLPQGSSTHRDISPSGESTASFSSRASTDATITTTTNNNDDGESKAPIANDLTLPYTSSLLTVLPFSAHHSHPIFPTRGNRRSGWYRSKSVASQGLSQITGVDYTTTCWYDVERLQNVVRDSISFQESSGLKSLEDLTEPGPSSATKN